MGKVSLVLLVLALAFTSCTAADGRLEPRVQKATRADPSLAVIDVSVATLWTKPRLLRAVDRPSARNPAQIRQWLEGMTTTERLWLVGRLETGASQYGNNGCSQDLFLARSLLG